MNSPITNRNMAKNLPIPSNRNAQDLPAPVRELADLLAEIAAKKLIQNNQTAAKAKDGKND